MPSPFRAHHDLYPTSVFDAVFNRPDTVFKILDPVFHFNKNLLDVYQAAYRTRAGTGNKSSNELANLDHLPAIKINSAVNDNNTHDKNFRVHINADGGHDIIKSYNVFVNGVPLFGKNGRPVVGPVLNQQVDIPLLPGKNAIEAIATNAAGLNSLPATLIEYLADSAGFKPHTYFIGVALFLTTKTRITISTMQQKTSGILPLQCIIKTWIWSLTLSWTGRQRGKMCCGYGRNFYAYPAGRPRDILLLRPRGAQTGLFYRDL